MRKSGLKALACSIILTGACAAFTETGAAADFIVGAANQGPGGSAQTAATGIAWSGSYTREGAASVALHIQNLDLKPGEALLVGNNEDAQVQIYHAEDGADIWTPAIAGDTLWLSLYTDAAQSFADFQVTEARVDFTDIDTVAARRAQVDSAFRQLRAKPVADEPAKEGATPKVIYGNDDRVEPFTQSDPRILRVVRATAALATKSSVTSNGSGGYNLTIAGTYTTAGGGTLCSDEPFRGQYQLGNCTGFLVGDDLLLTAGHCIENSTDCSTGAYVFDFQMQNASTQPATTVTADKVYFCTGIVSQALAGDSDYALVRLDRKVTDRTPLDIRRTGAAAVGSGLVLVGHPDVIPTKVAGGAVVKANSSGLHYFQANTDSYGGNSGSPVVNTTDYSVEGILVRGATDFRTRSGSNCVESNRVPDTGATGGGPTFEEITKTDYIASLIPALISRAGVVRFDKDFYSNGSFALVTLGDTDLAGQGSISLPFQYGSQPPGTLQLTEAPANSGSFSATFFVGALGLTHGDMLTIFYHDVNTGSGVPADVSDTATLDAIPPQFTNLSAGNITGTTAIIAIGTNEPSTASVSYSTTCGGAAVTVADSSSLTNHRIVLTGLTPQTTYYFVADVADAVGNPGTANNLGACYVFRTGAAADYISTLVTSGPDPILNQTLMFTPAENSDQYTVCRKAASTLPTDPTGGTAIPLGDDDSQEIDLSAPVIFFGVPYSKIFVNSNGNITFVEPNTDYTITTTTHFQVPRLSVYFADFNPEDGGTISIRYFGDRIAVTWNQVAYFQSTGIPPTATFQAEIYYDGRLAITHLLSGKQATAVIGISEGAGNPTGFTNTNFAAKPVCVDPISPTAFNFDSGDDGWTFITIGGAFSNPTSIVAGGRIGFQSTSNANNLAFWEKSDIPVSSAAGTLIRARYKVIGSEPDIRRVPTFRFRLSTPNFEQTAELVTTSTFAGSASPSPGGREYTQLYDNSTGVSGIRTDFDLINTDSSDNANGAITLDRVIIDSFAGGSLTDFREEATYVMTSASDWNPFTATPTYNAPDFARTPEGLQVTANPTDLAKTIFGFWSSPASNPAMTEARVYRFDYTVASSATPGNAVNTPTIRMRLNDETFMTSALLTIESVNGGTSDPTTSGAKVYSIYYLAPSSLGGKKFLYSFDYLWAFDSGNTPQIAVTLTNLHVTSYRLPF
ncbi:hypothetical protein BH09SUM1_BH09SUM1_10110 [soil metagenome]